MLFWKVAFWGSWLVILYNYAGYALIASALDKLFPLRSNKTTVDQPITPPPVTFIVAAYNEQDCLRAKVANCLAQDYAGPLEWIFITDGSTDASPDMLKAEPAVRLLHQPGRQGKSAALNRAVAAASHELIIVSDANTILNKEAIRLIARHYADPLVGGVAGEKKVVAATAGGTPNGEGTPTGGDMPKGGDPGEGEGLYWKYESALKRIDSRFYSVVGAAGELFSFRKKLFEPVPASVILDDFIISMRVAEQGYRVIYEPGACAMETPSFSLEDERKRKVRISAGGFQSVAMLGGVLQFWKHPRLSYLYISHRVLRWVASPFCLILATLAATVLFLSGTGPLYNCLWIALLLFYVLGFLAPVLPSKGPLKVAKLPHYFLFMNISVLQGFVRWLRGRQSATWEKARRAA